MVGTSPPALIPFFVKAIRTLQPYPDMLYDVGCGKGIYGYLFTQYCRKPRPLVRGCDLKFKQPLDVFYNCIDRIELESEFDTFDDYLLRDNTIEDRNLVVSMIEILEHLTKETGSKLLNFIGKTGIPLILTTPSHFYQSNTPEIPGAKHKCLWKGVEMIDLLKQYYEIVSVKRIRDTTYRTEHWGIIATNQPLKQIPEGIRDA